MPPSAEYDLELAWPRRIQYDEFGQRVQVVLGNGVVSRYAYDARTRRLAGLDTVTPLQRTLQLNSYAYDRVGNVLGISNSLPPASQHRSGPVSLRYQAVGASRRPGNGCTIKTEDWFRRGTSISPTMECRRLIRILTNTRLRPIIPAWHPGEACNAGPPSLSSTRDWTKL